MDIRHAMNAASSFFFLLCTGGCRLTSIIYLLAEWIVFAPNGDELRQVMRAQNGRVARQIVEAVHNDGDHNVEHNEAAQEDEGNKIEIGDVGAACLVRIHWQTCRLIELDGTLVAKPAGDTSHHDVRPGFSGRASKQHHESLKDGPKVVVALDGSVGIQVDVAEQLHAHDGVDEEQHHHQHHDIRQGLDGLHKGEEQDTDADAPAQQLDKSSGAEKPQEPNVNQLGGIDDTASHGDEIKSIPRIFKVGLVSK